MTQKSTIDGVTQTVAPNQPNVRRVRKIAFFDRSKSLRRKFVSIHHGGPPPRRCAGGGIRRVINNVDGSRSLLITVTASEHQEGWLCGSLLIQYRSAW